MENLERYFLENNILFEINNLTVDTFNSKINELSKGKVPIWFESFQESQDISRLLKVYKTSKDESAEEITEIIYWFIDKPASYNQADFLELIKQTANDFEKKYG